MAVQLYDFLPRDRKPDNDWLLDQFLAYVSAKHLTLYPAQEEAILELFAEKNVILNTPTGSGKSLVASALHFKAIAQGFRSVYTCPIKALVNEKWMTLCREFGPDNVGLSTGDATVNRDAPILCCTAEVLSNIALREGDQARVNEVVMDEFHWYADRDRGVAWQIPLLCLPQSRFLLMSATLGDTTSFEEELDQRTGRDTVTIRSSERPVPLEFSYAVTSLPNTVEQLIVDRKCPVYVVHFTQREAAESAQDFTSLKLCSREEKETIAAELSGVRFNSPYGPNIQRWLKQGIGIHHAGLLPKYRVLVEQLAQKGLLKVICGTDTLGVGINVPIRTVLFTRLCKFDGQKTTILTARDFHQISGRAGRKGFDEQGWVVAQAPAHYIENLQLSAKAARKGKKPVKRKPPERNFVNWDENTFQRLISASPERLESRFKITHGMLLNILSRPGDGCRATRTLIRECHDAPRAKSGHRRRAWQLFRSLLKREIVEVTAPDETGSYLRVNVELQDDFSMDQTLSLYLLETLPLLDPQDGEYPLDVVTLVESILEDPRIILLKQLDRVKSEKMAAMKAEGVEYDERMEELEKLEHPKPKREFVYSTFNAFADRHPWVGEENIHAKSIAREMFENFRSFADYIKDYELHRSEGLLLRHLSRVLKVLKQTVPETGKSPAILEVEAYLESMLREVDSSLLEEWERMRDPGFEARTKESVPMPQLTGAPAEQDITGNRKLFLASIRTEIFRFLRMAATGQYEAAIEAMPLAQDNRFGAWTADALGQVMETFYRDHETLCLDPEARNQRHTYVLTDESIDPPQDRWVVQQMLVDPEDLNDWVAEFEVDLPASRAAESAVLSLRRIGPLHESTGLVVEKAPQQENLNNQE